MNKISRFEHGFGEPDRRYGVFQIIHGGAADPSRAEYYDERGFAGIVGNIPYSREFPGNEKEWLDTEKGMREYIRRGMRTWIYDEKGYPSGTGGGYVTENHPEFIARGLYCYDYWRVISGPSVYRADVPDTKLWKAMLVPKDGGDPIDVTSCLNGNNVLYIDVPAGQYYLFMMCVRRLFDGTHATESYSEPRNYISLSDKKAVETFISCTHENYRAHIGDEFGKGVLAMFTDEPSLISWNIRTGVFPILPWLDSYPEDFMKRCGYPLEKACVAVVLGRGDDVIKRRCDFWDFIADTVADGFFGTIRDWCHKNGLKSSGHMLEEERLQAHVINYGSFYRCAKRFDWPGIDQLSTETGPLMYDGSIPIARFLASFADISGEREVFTEFSDHSVRERGEVAGLDCYYGSVNWHLAMGVNNFTSYYSWNGITAEEQRAFNKYTARSGWLLRQGRRDSRCAVFYPEAAMWASYTPSTKARGIDESPKTRMIDKAFAGASWALLRRQIDFDYIDRAFLVEAKIEGGKLVKGDRAYSAIIMPCARVLETDAAEKLTAAAKAGITVLFCDDIPEACRESGEENGAVKEIGRMVDAGEMAAAPLGGFGDLIDKAIPRDRRTIYLKDEKGGRRDMILSHCRVTDDGCRIVYIANMADADYEGTLCVPGGFACAASADAFTGEISPAEYADAPGRAEIEVRIRPGEGRFWLLEEK